MFFRYYYGLQEIPAEKITDEYFTIGLADNKVPDTVREKFGITPENDVLFKPNDESRYKIPSVRILADSIVISFYIDESACQIKAGLTVDAVITRNKILFNVKNHTEEETADYFCRQLEKMQPQNASIELAVRYILLQCLEQTAGLREHYAHLTNPKYQVEIIGTDKRPELSEYSQASHTLLDDCHIAGEIGRIVRVLKSNENGVLHYDRLGLIASVEETAMKTATETERCLLDIENAKSEVIYGLYNKIENGKTRLKRICIVLFVVLILIMALGNIAVLLMTSPPFIIAVMKLIDVLIIAGLCYCAAVTHKL